MQHILKATLTVGAFALTLGMAQAQDLAPLNSDSEPDRMDWSELEAKFGPLPAPAAGTKVGGVSKTLTNEYWRSLGEGYQNVATKLGLEFVYQAAQNEGDQLGQLSTAENLISHAFAAGYPLHEAAGHEALLAELDRLLGLARLGAIHLNDSQGACGSRRDRHANIGEGEIGTAAFRRLLRDERLRRVPMLLETPLGDDGAGHARDLATLRRLAGDVRLSGRGRRAARRAG